MFPNYKVFIIVFNTYIITNKKKTHFLPFRSRAGAMAVWHAALY